MFVLAVGRALASKPNAILHLRSKVMSVDGSVIEPTVSLKRWHGGQARIQNGRHGMLLIIRKRTAIKKKLMNAVMPVARTVERIYLQ